MLILAYIILGFTSVTAQIIILRELAVSSGGNELSYGVTLALWLLGNALGSWGIGRLTDRLKEKNATLVVIEIVISILLPLTIFLCRSARWIFGISQYELIMPLQIPLLSLFLLPLAVTLGFGFILCCRLASEKTKGTISGIGRVYILDAVGALLGGIAFYYLFSSRLSPFQMAAFIGIINLIVAIGLTTSAIPLHAGGRIKVGGIIGRRPRRTLLMLLLTLYLISIPSGLPQALEKFSAGLQFKGRKLLTYRSSRYGNIAVTQSNGEKIFYTSGVLSFTTQDTAFNEERANLVFLQHPNPERILIIGGGLGGLIEEALKHNPRRLDYVELDPELVRAAEEFGMEYKDPRLRIFNMDGRRFVKTSRIRYDVLFINLPDPSTLQINRFYTREFFQEAASILSPGGIIALSVSSKREYIGGEIARYNASILNTVRSVFRDLIIIPGDEMFIIASNKSDVLTYKTGILIQRFNERNISAQYFSPYHIVYRMDRQKTDYILGRLKTQEVRLNTDYQPVCFYYDLLLWGLIAHPGFSKMTGLLLKIEPRHLASLIVGIVILLIVIILIKPRLRTISIPYLIGTTGFFGMGIELLVVFLYQIRFGYIYYKLGLIITSFMVGLAVGGLIGTKLANRVKGKSILLSRIQLIMVIYSFLAPSVLIRLAPGEWAYFPFVLIGGLFVGCEFPLASSIYLRSAREPGRAAGVIYAADLIGATIGALLMSLLILPLFGLTIGCMLIGLSCISGSILLTLARQIPER